MLPSTQLCSAVPASEDVSVGTHTRLTSGLKACISVQLFMPFKCCKSKRHTGRVGNGQTSCHSDENIALCVVEQLGWRGRRTQAAHSGGRKPQWTSKGSFPGSGQAGVLMIPHQQPAVPGISQVSAPFLLLPPPLPVLPPFHIYSFFECPLSDRPTNLLYIQEVSGSLTCISSFLSTVLAYHIFLFIAQGIFS